MDDKCMICGKENDFNATCCSCGKMVCSNCFNVEESCCIYCWNEGVNRGTKVDKKSKCLDCGCSFDKNGFCSYGGEMYERPCYIDRGYFEDDED